MNVVDSKSLERDAGGKPASTFPHPALEFRLAGKWYALDFAARDTFNLGTLKGVGRVYRQTFIDTYAKAGLAKL